MKQQSLPTPDAIEIVRKKLFEIAEAGGGHFFYSDIRKELKSLISSGNEKQAKDIAIDIMKSYTYRPALIWELKQLLTDNELVDFKNWRKTAKSNKPKAKCSKCDSEKIARIIYGMQMYSEKLEKQLERGTVVIGGCCVTNNDPNYECIDCGMQFYKRPTGKNSDWTGKIVARHTAMTDNIPVHINSIKQ